MKIHEYQARQLLSDAGIPVPSGRMIESIEDAAAAYKDVCPTPGGLAVIKAQVHAGGRGKAGFVKLVHSADEATQAARFMLTNRMKSPQTPPEGLEVTKLLVAAGVDIADRRVDKPVMGNGHEAMGKAGPGAAASSPIAHSPSPIAPPKEEFYLAITTDRKSRRNTLIASREGGVEIEQVAHDRPDAIIKEPIHPLLGLQPHQARRIAFNLGLRGKQATQAAKIMVDLARLFVEKDCTLAEINPLVIATTPGLSESSSEGPGGSRTVSPSHRLTVSSSVLAIDAKFNFDDNALFRHPDLQAMADPTEENPAETRAHRFGLSYIALDGTIGCLVNGAGLAMATMDIVKLHGGDPANFLDVGGSASEEAVTEAFSIILSDPKVKGVLVNIFGGIMKCDIIAAGIINAARGYKNPDGSTGFKVPLVVRLEGTNVEAGRKLLEEAKKSIPTMQAATDLADAAKKVCAAVRRS
jgi:succinyl-CoA synthetase beta subunit